MNLSENFTLEEATRSQTAARRGIDNTPTPEVIANMTEAAGQLEAVRTMLNAPLDISSWYRSPKLNAAIGGSASSAHVHGYAIDFTARGPWTPLSVCEAIRDAGIAFDQLIYEGAWTHISFAPAMRQQIMTARFSGGKTTYTQGLS